MQLGVITGPDGATVLTANPIWAGPPETGQARVEEITRLATLLMAHVAPQSYAMVLDQFDGQFPGGRHVAMHTRTVPSLTPPVVAALDRAGATKASPLSTMFTHSLHGEAARIPLDSTPVGIRSPHQVIEIVATWENGDAEARSTGRGPTTSPRPWRARVPARRVRQPPRARRRRSDPARLRPQHHPLAGDQGRRRPRHGLRRHPLPQRAATTAALAITGATTRRQLRPRWAHPRPAAPAHRPPPPPAPGKVSVFIHAPAWRATLMHDRRSIGQVERVRAWPGGLDIWWAGALA